jgi:hypothetical protein
MITCNFKMESGNAWQQAVEAISSGDNLPFCHYCYASAWPYYCRRNAVAMTLYATVQSVSLSAPQ